MEKPRYTEKQILCGLRELFSKLGGMNTPFDADTRIDHFYESNRRWYHEFDDDDFEFIDFFLALSYYFRFRCTPEEWSEYFHLDLADYRDDKEDWERLVAPGLTFGALARFISERAPGVSFESVSVIDRECRPAGVFYGIQRVVKNTIEDAHWFPPPEKSITPSTKIIDVIRGYQLDEFWVQLRWMTERGVPELPAIWRHFEMIVIAVLTCLTLTALSVTISLEVNEIYIFSVFAVSLLQ